MPSTTSNENVALLSRISRDRKLGLLLRHIRAGSLILEVGAGAGWFSRGLRRQGHEVRTLDLMPPADIIGDIKDWKRLGLKAGSFDVIVALEVIEHVDCWDDLKELCKPGGWIFLSSPVPRFDWACRMLETAGLTQRRTSPHCNLVDFTALDIAPFVLKRPLGIHQVGLFKKPK
jgi:2-polyprenyl-3-methyl-5-hydroxy-6-metoxy-1,4-benzoquinol methylase